MASCPNKNDANWQKLVETVGESTAYEIYSAQKEQVPIIGFAQNGNASILYKDLINSGRKDALNLWYKSMSPTSVNGDYQRDINGEPVYSDYVDITPYKAVQYTSSESQEVNNVVNAAHKYAQDVYIALANERRSHPNPRIDDALTIFASNDINKDIHEIELANLVQALSSVLKLNEYRYSHEADAFQKGGIKEQLTQYLNLDLETLNSNPKLRSDFWKFMSYAKQFLDGFTNVETLQSVDNIELTDGEKAVNNLAKQFQKLSPEITNLKSKFDQLMGSAYESSISPFSTNPEIIYGLRKLFEITDDENTGQLMLDAMGDTHVAFIANMVKKFTYTMTNAQLEYIEEQKKFADLLRSTFGITDLSQLTETHFDKYLEKNKEGGRTRQLKQKYDWDKFNTNKKIFFEEVSKLKETNHKEYIKRVKQWYAKNEKTIVSKDEIKNIIAQKKEELNGRQFAEWMRKNIMFSEDGEINVKLGDHIFKEPSDDYIKSDWHTIENDPLFKYLNDIAIKMGNYIGKETLFKEGYLPSMSIKEKDNLLFIKNIEAWYETQGVHNKSKMFAGSNNQIIRILTVPMMEQFSHEETIKYRDFNKSKETFEEWQDEVLAQIAEAGKGDFKSIKEVNAHNKEVIARNNTENAKQQNYNLYKVFNTFIKEATIYKYKADLKYEYDLALHQIRNMDFNKRTGAGKLLKNFAGSNVMNKDIHQTKTGEGSNLENHFDQWLEAIFYENFDIDEGTRTKIASILMKYVSAKNMWLNLTAGISNIAYNRAQIRAESIAGYYFNQSDLFKADKMYTTSLLDMLSNNGKQERNTLVGALVQLFDITQNTNEKDYAAGMFHKKLMSSDTLYMFNNAGEHYSQNIPLIAMLNNHRIINGDIIGYNQFRYNNYRTALNNILSPEQKIKLDQYWESRFKKEDFKEGKKDYLRDFILSLDRDTQHKFLEERKNLDASSKTEFEKYATVIDSYVLKDGIATHEDKVTLDGKTYDTHLNEYAFAAFKDMVMKVNQKNNGIYNKEDASTSSRRALGKMALQFRKYMRPSWNKRFGSKFGKGYWNERRNEWDKGSYISLLQFMASPYKAIDFSESEANMVMQFMERMVKGTTNLATNVGIYWTTLDDFEKANVKRAAMELGILTVTIMIGAMLKGLKPDDPDDDIPFAYNLAVYQTDRLMSELMFYTPIGLVNEGQKILRSPAAVQGAILDWAKFTGNLVAYPFRTDKERIYQTGMYRKESKLEVSTEKLIPIINKWQQLNRINKFNKYYILFRG